MIGVARRETQIFTVFNFVLAEGSSSDKPGSWLGLRLNHSSAHTTRMADFQSCSNSESSALSVGAETSAAAAFYTGLTRKTSDR